LTREDGGRKAAIRGFHSGRRSFLAGGAEGAPLFPLTINI
jgi:hypothetical protein